MAPEHQHSFVRDAFDTLSVSVAVLGADGAIVWTNDHWRAFGADNGADPTAIGVGANYLTAVRDSDEYAIEAVTALGHVLDGEQTEFTMEYPCHAPDVERWFLMWASGFETNGERYAVVAHFDVTDRVGAERALVDQQSELTRQRDHLALLNQLVRHDIRNDIQLVLLHAEALADVVPVDEHDHIDRVMQQAGHIVDLTEAVRDLSAVIIEDSDPDLSPVNLGAVLRVEADKIRSAFLSSGKTVTVTGTDSLSFDTTVLANEMLSSVIGNLLSNAVIHNDSETPHVDISVEHQSEAVAVTVADDGPGIENDHRERIFDRGEMSLDSPGTGLGLYLVDRLVTLYGGTVRVERSHLGGAAFTIELQLAP
jgi:signal transduction histidine kinase